MRLNRRAVKHDPHPPTPQQAAAILNAAFTYLSWGCIAVAGDDDGRQARRAVRSLLDLDNAVLVIRTSIAQDSAKTWEKDIKTPTTPYRTRRGYCGMLRAYRQQCEADSSGRCNHRDRRSHIFTIC